jgi:hypothetical protein
MTTETLAAATNLFGWMSLMNFAVLLIWVGALLAARPFIYRLHQRWFDIDAPTLDRIQYGALGAFKLLWLFFNLVPYVALKLAF